MDPTIAEWFEPALHTFFFGFTLASDWWFRHDFAIPKHFDLAFDHAPQVTIPVEHLIASLEFVESTSQVALATRV